MAFRSCPFVSKHLYVVIAVQFVAALVSVLLNSLLEAFHLRTFHPTVLVSPAVVVAYFCPLWHSEHLWPSGFGLL